MKHYVRHLKIGRASMISGRLLTVVFSFYFFINFLLCSVYPLCFDAVGWVAGKASGV